MANAEVKKLVKRIYYGMKISLDTPLCVSNGDSEMTDNDILRSWDDKPFIPGTSFAGAFRAFCEEGGNEDVDQLFGFSTQNDGRMSCLWISDFYFDGDVSTSIRDGVKLKDKVAVEKGKYDYEVLEHGTGMLYMQLLIWDGMDEKKADEAIRKIAGGISAGDIRLGGQKNRGLGKMKLDAVYCKEFFSDNVQDWIDFSKEKLVIEKDKDGKEANKKDLSEFIIKSERYVTISVPLRLTGGLSIRQYSTKVNQPDFVSLMRHFEKDAEDSKGAKNPEHPVIPGSSWKGAIRQRMTDILSDMNVEGLVEGCKYIWGYVLEEDEKKEDSKNAKASDMMVSESTLEGNSFIKSTRNQISRFENATVKNALYTERCAVNGNTVLEIKVKPLVKKMDDEKEKESTDWFIGLMLLAIKDIQKGYLAIGGETSIGRGIFAEEGEVSINNGKTETEYIEALRKMIKEANA